MTLHKRSGNAKLEALDSPHRNFVVGPPLDSYEEEADRVANQVVRSRGRPPSPDPSISITKRENPPAASDPGSNIVQTTASHANSNSPQELEDRINSLWHTGQPLKPSIRGFMEPRLGHNFSQVRIHCGQGAAALTAKLNTQAFTVDHHIFVGGTEFDLGEPPRSHLLAHELVHVVQQGETKSHGKAVIRRYGHAKSCKVDDHLKPFVWPGHDHATNITSRALEELQKHPLHPTVKSQLGQFFGQDSATAANVKTIRDNFQRIHSALGEQYLYHCADPCEPPNKGARAWTDQSGNKDITICFDQVKRFTAQAAGWVIAHENVHRGLNIWPPHLWAPKDFDGCLLGLGAGNVAQSSLVLDNPDSYAFGLPLEM
jgi:hypothetical protein